MRIIFEDFEKSNFSMMQISTVDVVVSLCGV